MSPRVRNIAAKVTHLGYLICMDCPTDQSIAGEYDDENCALDGMMCDWCGAVFVETREADGSRRHWAKEEIE